MKRKPIKVDWDELEVAFSNQNEDEVYYLDLVNGHVILEGEGGEDLDDEDYATSATAPSPGRNDPFRLYVDPVEDDTKVKWMADFVGDDGSVAREQGLEDAHIEALREAMESDAPADRLHEVVLGDATTRDAWYAYRADRVRSFIEEWIEQNEVVVTEAPPWR